jgi:transcriptional regulator of arginine metabolism
MTPTQRQKAILEIVESRAVKSQREIGSLLFKQGFKTTQSTLSRDIAELGLVKGASGYMQPAPNGRELTSARGLRATLRAFVLSIETVVNQIIIRTTSGGANAAADPLDDAGWSEVAGTVAGDDTILIIARGTRQAKAVADRIQKLIA